MDASAYMHIKQKNDILMQYLTEKQEGTKDKSINYNDSFYTSGGRSVSSSVSPAKGKTIKLHQGITRN
jgi:hypothetical protein